MKIIHICDLGDVGVENGITIVISNLIKEQRALGEEVYLFNIRNNGKTQSTTYDKVVESYTNFKKYITDIVPDIVIFHSIYYSKYIFYSHYLFQKNIPYLIQLHGGGSGLAQSISKWKKSLANPLIFNRIVKKSKALIFLNENEIEKAVVFKHLSHNIIIPNGCVIPGPYTKIEVDERFHFLFLARIDVYIKGLDILIDAISKIHDEIKDCCIFDFYGNLENDNFLKLINPYKDVIKYHGAAYGDQKDLAFKSADAFILTSRSEGMPMSVIEALSYGLPCLITPQTNMSKIVGTDAGWVTECNSDAIAKRILEIIKLSKSQLLGMGNKARAAIAPYSWSEVAKVSLREYTKILQGPKR